MPTKFQEKVYNLCKKVPKGKVTTYKELAHAMNSRAYRAVGQAMHNNPHYPRVPCHRVVSSNGSIGGFAHGSKAKTRLLESEGIKIKDNKIIDFEKVLFRF